MQRVNLALPQSCAHPGAVGGAEPAYRVIDKGKVMTTGEIETLPSHTELYTAQPVADQPLAPDGLDLSINLARYGWVKAKNLLMTLLKCVDHWVHRSQLVCKSTRNCIVCHAGDDQLKRAVLLEKRAEYLLFRKESDMITSPSPHNILRGSRSRTESGGALEDLTAPPGSSVRVWRLMSLSMIILYTSLTIVYFCPHQLIETAPRVSSAGYQPTTTPKV